MKRPVLRMPFCFTRTTLRNTTSDHVYLTSLLENTPLVQSEVQTFHLNGSALLIMVDLDSENTIHTCLNLMARLSMNCCGEMAPGGTRSARSRSGKLASGDDGWV